MSVEKVAKTLRLQGFNKKNAIRYLKSKYALINENKLLEIYELTGENNIKCSHCNSVINKNNRYCTKCGSEINPPEKKQSNECSKCGKEYSSEIIFCPDDGTKLDKTVIELKKIQIESDENEGNLNLYYPTGIPKMVNKTQNTREGKYIIDDRDKTKINDSKDLPMNWFGFYTYVRLPISILASIYSLYTIGLESFYSMVLVISIILSSLLIYEFDKKSIMGWNLN